MSNLNRRFKKTAVAMAFALAIGASATVFSSSGATAPNVQISGSYLTANAPSEGTVIKVVLRVVLPDGTVDEYVSDSGSVAFDASTFSDGSYRYEAWALLSNADGKYMSGQSRGQFKVTGGSIDQAPAATEEETSMLDDGLGVVKSATIAAMEFVFPAAEAAPLISQDTGPSVYFRDTSNGVATEDDWRILGYDGANGSFRIFDDIDDTNFNNKVVLQINTPANGQSTENSIVVDNQGDVILADGKLHLDRLFGQLGLGTSAPVQAIHALSSKNMMVRLENPANSTWDFGQYDALFSSGSSDGDFRINLQANGNGGPTGTRLSIKDENGFVGIGTSAPLSTLHVQGASDTRLLVKNTTASASAILMDLEHNGIPAFRLNNTAVNNKWTFASQSDQSFTLSKAGSGFTEMKIRANGDVEANGDVYAKGVMLTSSRAAKTDIVPIKATEVMEKLKQIEIAEWHYKTSDKNDRHISPMAEDFYSLFKFGPSNKHINPNDLASVALIAAKELQKKSEIASIETATLKAESLALKAENALLKAQDAKLQARLASLEKLVTNLASSGNLLPETGAKVVLMKK